MANLSQLLSSTLNALGWLTTQLNIGLAYIDVMPDVTFNDKREKNGKKLPDGIEIRFGKNVPSVEVRERLKSAGFRFSEKQQMWYAFDDENTKEFIAQFRTEMVAATPMTDDYDEGERHAFWARVPSLNAYNKLSAITEFKVNDKTYASKNHLSLQKHNLDLLIDKNQLYFKKYYTKKSETGTATSRSKKSEIAEQEAEQRSEQQNEFKTKNKQFISKSQKFTSNYLENDLVAEKLEKLAAAMEYTLSIYKTDPKKSVVYMEYSLTNLALKALAMEWRMDNWKNYKGEDISVLKNLNNRLAVYNFMVQFTEVEHNGIPSKLKKLGIKNEEIYSRTYFHIMNRINEIPSSPANNLTATAKRPKAQAIENNEQSINELATNNKDYDLLVLEAEAELEIMKMRKAAYQSRPLETTPQTLDGKPEEFQFKNIKGINREYHLWMKDYLYYDRNLKLKKWEWDKVKDVKMFAKIPADRPMYIFNETNIIYRNKRELIQGHQPNHIINHVQHRIDQNLWYKKIYSPDEDNYNFVEPDYPYYATMEDYLVGYPDDLKVYLATVALNPEKGLRYFQENLSLNLF